MNDLPPLVRQYFESSDSAEQAACFAANAEVHDEGHSYQGREAIQAWIDDARRKYRHTSQPLRWIRFDNDLQVLVQVSGAFPGSPIEVDFAFKLGHQGRISKLVIG